MKHTPHTIEIDGDRLLDALELAYKQRPAEDHDATYAQWITSKPGTSFASDPTPEPLTVADLSPEDRCGYALALYRNNNPSGHAQRWYLTERETEKSVQYRKLFNAEAAAVIEAFRTIQRERGDVVVPGDRDERHDVDLFFEAEEKAEIPDDKFDGYGTRAGIRAFLAHHAERGDAGSGRG